MQSDRIGSTIAYCSPRRRKGMGWGREKASISVCNYSRLHNYSKVRGQGRARLTSRPAMTSLFRVNQLLGALGTSALPMAWRDNSKNSDSSGKKWIALGLGRERREERESSPSTSAQVEYHCDPNVKVGHDPAFIYTGSPKRVSPFLILFRLSDLQSSIPPSSHSSYTRVLVL
jgi:hypothetical protein